VSLPDVHAALDLVIVAMRSPKNRIAATAVLVLLCRLVA
jgi:hypothetical protein